MLFVKQFASEFLNRTRTTASCKPLYCQDFLCNSIAAYGSIEERKGRIPKRARLMKFIQMTGKVLADVIKDDELHAGDLEATGVGESTIVRINQQGDIEIRRPDGWDVIGGLLGDFEARVKQATGLEWA